VRLIIRGDSEPAVEQFSSALGHKLRAAIGAAAIENRVLGPAPCPIAKLRGLFRYHILLSSPDSKQFRESIRSVVESCEQMEGVQWVVDVDPLDLL